MTRTVTFNVEMHCGGCENAVRTALNVTDGVLRTDADHRRSEVRIQFDSERVSEAVLRDRLRESGFESA